MLSQPVEEISHNGGRGLVRVVMQWLGKVVGYGAPLRWNWTLAVGTDCCSTAET